MSLTNVGAFLILLTLFTLKSLAQDPGQCGQLTDSLNELEKTSPSFPWIVSLQVRLGLTWRHICAGTIISRDWVLTAAHCVKNRKIKIERINAGSKEWSKPFSIHEADTLIVHSKNPNYSDIAVVHVTPPFSFSKGINGRGSISPICLPFVQNLAMEGIANVAGWGSFPLFNGSQSSSEPYGSLDEANVALLSSEVCARQPDFFRPIAYICAGPVHNKPPDGSCYGDVGGPLMGMIKGKVVQIGVISGKSTESHLCKDPENPSQYSKVSFFRTWIYFVTGV